MTQSLVETITIKNKKGLHARAAAKFVKVVNAHDVDVKVTRMTATQTLFDADDGEPWTASGGSVLGVLTLGAEQGASLKLELSGPDAHKTLSELCDLINRKFDEE